MNYERRVSPRSRKGEQSKLRPFSASDVILKLEKFKLSSVVWNFFPINSESGAVINGKLCLQF